jgi:hypothetical protein
MERTPLPTMGVSVDVNTDDDCTRNVITPPNAMATYLPT